MLSRDVRNIWKEKQKLKQKSHSTLTVFMCTSNRSDASVISINIVLTVLIKPRFPQTGSAWTCPTGWHWPLVASPGAAVHLQEWIFIFNAACFLFSVYESINDASVDIFYVDNSPERSRWNSQFRSSCRHQQQRSNVLTVNAFFTSWKDRMKLFISAYHETVVWGK